MIHGPARDRHAANLRRGRRRRWRGALLSSSEPSAPLPPTWSAAVDRAHRRTCAATIACATAMLASGSSGRSAQCSSQCQTQSRPEGCRDRSAMRKASTSRVRSVRTMAIYCGEPRSPAWASARCHRSSSPKISTPAVSNAYSRTGGRRRWRCRRSGPRADFFPPRCAPSSTIWWSASSERMGYWLSWPKSDGSVKPRRPLEEGCRWASRASTKDQNVHLGTEALRMADCQRRFRLIWSAPLEVSARCLQVGTLIAGTRPAWA